MSDHIALAHRLRAAAAAYYDSDAELMTDAEYDAGIETLEAAVKETPALAETFADLLTQVAAGQSAGGDVEHGTMMGSLSKIKTLEETAAFLELLSAEVVAEPKLDGLSLRAVYRDGELVLVARRGDGQTGEDVTEQAKALNFLPHRVSPDLPFGNEFEIRGEAYMDDAKFESVNASRVLYDEGPVFKNSRNAAAGILTKGDPNSSGHLSFAVFDLIVGQDSRGDFTSHSSRMFELETAVAGPFMSHPPFTTARSLVAGWTGLSAIGAGNTQLRAVTRAIEDLENKRPTLGFPIDGLVLKANHDADRERLGMGSRHPNWATAFKYAPVAARTKVVDITTAVGRTGRLAIRVEVEPVDVHGTTITYATGHNVSWMQERDIRIGDTITIERANDVIPYISRVHLEDRPVGAPVWQPPATDPNGGQWDKSTLLWRSTDPTLSVSASLLYATSRDALDIEGIGTEVVDALIDAGITTFVDLFTATSDELLAELSDLKLAEGRNLGAKNAVKIVAEVQEARTMPWARVITALGIRGTGRTMSRRLATSFPSLELLRDATVDQLMEVEGVALKKAELIRFELDNLDAGGLLGQLAQCGITTGAQTSSYQHLPLEGMTVVVSGSVPGFTRTTIAEKIEALGGKSSGSVSGSTSLLVSAPSTSSKYVKAQSAGVKIVTPQEFLEMIS